MLLKLYCSSKHVPDQITKGRRYPILQECNAGFPYVMYLLWLLKNNGTITEIVDSNLLSKVQLRSTYESAIPVSVSKKYRIRTVFGTKHSCCSRFGVEVPALLVYEEEGQPLIDIYPHIRTEKMIMEEARIATISSYLLYLYWQVSGKPWKQLHSIF